MKPKVVSEKKNKANDTGIMRRCVLISIPRIIFFFTFSDNNLPNRSMISLRYQHIVTKIREDRDT